MNQSPFFIAVLCGLVGCGEAPLSDNPIEHQDSSGGSTITGATSAPDAAGGLGGAVGEAGGGGRSSYGHDAAVDGSFTSGGSSRLGGITTEGGAGRTRGASGGAGVAEGRAGSAAGGSARPVGVGGASNGSSAVGGRAGNGSFGASAGGSSAGEHAGHVGGAAKPAGGASGSGGARAGTGGSTGKAGAGGAGSGGPSGDAPCPGATDTLTVGSGQEYSTVQAAVNAISSSNSKPIRISVKAGKYKEQVTINKPFVCLTGESATTTVITNALGTNIVSGGTVLVTGNDFSAADIAFENTGGDGSGQAVALMAKGQRQQFRNCRFLSYQDTLYVNTGTQYFKDCYIQGDTDYIFGDATAVFENCTMNNIAEGTAVTAPRTPQSASYGFVFLGGALTANPTTSSVRSNHVYLGRPWGPYGAAAFLNVAMGAHIAAAGWTTMSSNTLANTRFSEYKSTGAGANASDSTRASRQLTDAQAGNYTVEKVLSPWVPGYSQ